MNQTKRRFLSHSLFVVILVIAAWLRLSGSYWGDENMHPDERGIYDRLTDIRLVAAPKADSWTGSLFNLIDRNLRMGAVSPNTPHIDSPDLNPGHYAYGSLPYYMGRMAVSVAENVRHNPAWGRLGYGLLFLGLAFLCGSTFGKLYTHSPRDTHGFWQFFALRPGLYGFVLFVLFSAGELLLLSASLQLAGTWIASDGMSVLIGIVLFLVFHILAAGRVLAILFDSRKTLASQVPRWAKIGFALLAAGVGLRLLVAGVAVAAATRPQHAIIQDWLVARPLSAICGILTVWVLYRIGRRFFGFSTGLLAAAFLAFTVLHIQLCHYYAFDTVLALFASLAVLYCCHIATRSRFTDYLWAGFFIGLAIASKFSAVLLPPLYILAFALSWFAPKRERPIERVVGFFAGGILSVLTLLVSEPFAFLAVNLPKAVPGQMKPPTYEILSLGAFVIAFLVLWNLIMVYRVAMRGRFWTFIAAGVVFGILCALRSWGLIFAPLYTIAILIRLLREYLAPHTPGRCDYLGLRWVGVFALLLFIAGFFTFQNVRDGVRQADNLPTFFGPSRLGIAFTPSTYPYFGSPQFQHDIKEQTRMAKGMDFVWTYQYAHTPALGFQVHNLFQLSMGPPLAILCLIGLGWFTWHAFTRWDRATLVIAAWLLANILVVGTFQTKFSRYMAPYLPFLCFAGAVFACHWSRAIPTATAAITARARRLWFGGYMARLAPRHETIRRSVIALTVIALVWSALYSRAFVKDIYHTKHTRIVASEWIYNNIPRGSVILHEHWDDPVPNAVPGMGDMGMYAGGELPMYEEDFPRDDKSWNTAQLNRNKYENIASNLERGDYIALAGRKLYGSIMRDENKRFRYASQFYKLLYSGRLGYEHVASFVNHVHVLGLEIDDDEGEESFNIYDHPKITVFKKVKAFTRQEYLEMLTTPALPDVQALTISDVMNAEGALHFEGENPPRTGRPIWQPEVHYPRLRWLTLLFLLTLIAIPYNFRVCGGLPDRGLLLAKPVGVLLLAYFAWLIPSLHLAKYGAQLIWIVFFLLAAGALALHVNHRREFREHLSKAWPAWLAGELLFLLIFAVFIWIRMMNPDIRGSEKHMDFSFMNATYRTDFFPPLDPWVSTFTVNYYYWGHMLYATLGLFSGVPPSYAYTLAMGTAPALAFLAAVAVIYAMTRRIRYGVLGGFLAVFAGNFVGYLQAARNLAANGHQLNLRLTFMEYLGSYGRVLKSAWQTLWSLDDGVLPATLQPIMWGFDSYFWFTGHQVDHRAFSDLIPGAVATEFPMWTYLYADLHAHLMAMAFMMTFAGLVLSMFLARGNGLRLFGQGTSWILSALMLGLVLGALNCINPWDLPTCAMLLALALTLKFLRNRSGWFAERRGAVEGLRQLGVRSPRWQRFYLFLRAFATDVALPLAVIVVLGYMVLYWPFKTNFEPRVSNAKLTDMAFTPVLSFWKIFAFFIVVIVPFLLFGLARWARERTWGGVLALCASIVIIGAAAALYPSWSQGNVGEVVQRLWWKLPFQREVGGYTAFNPKWGLFLILVALSVINLMLLLRKSWGASTRFALLMTFVGLCIGWGCEFLYMYEGWGGNSQRWNTTFKFHMHVWLLFSLASPVLLKAGLKRALGYPSSGAVRARGNRVPLMPLVASGERSVAWIWLILVVWFLGAVAVFPVFGTYANLWGPGARCVQGDRRSLDGLTYLAKQEGGNFFPGEYEAVAWFNRNVPGNSSVVIEAAPGGYTDLGRWGVNTGMPSVLGWAHHIGERLHVPEKYPRIEAITKFYGAGTREECLNTIRRYGIDYIIVGGIERRGWNFESFRVEGQAESKFKQWGDVLDLVFDNSAAPPGSPGLQIYRVRKNLNQYGMAPVVPSATGGIVAARPTLKPLPSPVAVPTAEPIDETPAGEAPAVPPVNSGLGMFEGGRGPELGRFFEARGIFVGPDRLVYIADSFNHRVQVFNLDGTFNYVIGGRQGQEAGEFNEPNSVIADASGNIYVADMVNGRVIMFEPGGMNPRILASRLFGPRCVRMGPDGNLYVSDTGNKVVRVYSPAGDELRIIGREGLKPAEATGPGVFNHPWGLAFTPEGNIVVADTVNKRIQILTLEGKFIKAFPVNTLNSPKADGFPDPTEANLALDNKGRLFISDSTGKQILAYDLEGSMLGSISEGGEIRQTFDRPAGVALTPEGDLLITDVGLNRVFRIPAAMIDDKFGVN